MDDKLDIIMRLTPESVARLRTACQSAPIWIDWEHAWLPLCGNVDPGLVVQCTKPVPFTFKDLKYVYDSTVDRTRWVGILDCPEATNRGIALAVQSGAQDPDVFIPVLVAINDMPPLSTSIKFFLANLEHVLVTSGEVFYLTGEFGVHDPGQRRSPLSV